MKGIELTYNGQTIKAAGYAGVVMSNKESGLRICLVGCAPDHSYTYFSRELQPGDDIFVTYEDMDTSDVSTPFSILDYGNPEEVKSKILNEYYRLRRELIDEGMLDGEE